VKNRFLSLLLAVAAFAAVPVRAQQPAAVAMLQPGDAVRITVWRKPELSGEFFVTGDGTVSHPMYSDVHVAGMPFTDARDRLRAAVERYEQSPRVLVEPLYRVTIGGEVRQPNVYTLRPETTVGQTVALAGGTTERGSLSRVRLLRGGTVITVDLTQPEAGLAQSLIQSGDQIMVARSPNVFREYITPLASITAALAALLNIALR
jgi:protein involved in polysaccharide export with SLBB domain